MHPLETLNLTSVDFLQTVSQPRFFFFFVRKILLFGYAQIIHLSHTSSIQLFGLYACKFHTSFTRLIHLFQTLRIETSPSRSGTKPVISVES